MLSADAATEQNKDEICLLAMIGFIPLRGARLPRTQNSRRNEEGKNAKQQLK